MEPFKITGPLHDMADPYPAADTVLRAAAEGGEQAKLSLARLWLSEGIPYAFQKRPGIYEAVRAWIGSRLGVDPKEVSITGSARIGQSLAPRKLGQPFSENSDLDAFVVSAVLFERLRDDFNAWTFDYESGKVHPQNPREEDFWRDNVNRGPRLIQRGFLDAKLIPNLEHYHNTRSINQTMYLLREKLRVTPAAPKVASASLRTYRNWNSFARQVSLNLTVS